MLLQMAVDTRSTRNAESLGMLSCQSGSGDSWLASLMVLCHMSLLCKSILLVL